jgi:hypothetical protein
MMEKMMIRICAARFVVGLFSLGFIGFLFFDLLFAILSLLSILANLFELVLLNKTRMPIFVCRFVILTAKGACQKQRSLPFAVLPGSPAS